MFLQFIGLEVGILAMFYEYVFVNLHLNYSEHVPLWTYFAQLLYAHSAYGYDRLLDVKRNETDNQELIEYVNNNTEQINITLTITIIGSILCLLQNNQTIPLIFPFLVSVFYYRKFKQLFPLLKPFFICALLVTSSIIFPSIVIEHNNNILNDMNALLPPFANLYSSSNYLDIIDYNIDLNQNINTLPVIYGNNTALIASLTANTISLVSHINHPYFNTNPINYFFQAQNLLSGFNYIFNKNQIDFRKTRKDDKTPKMILSKCFRQYPVISPLMYRTIPKCLV